MFLSRICLWKLCAPSTVKIENHAYLTFAELKWTDIVSYVPWLTSWEEDMTTAVLGQSQLLA